FTENKKRYAGLTYDGKIDIVGFEAIRGDWCDIAKETQRVVIEKILLSGISEAVKAVKGVIMKMKRKDFDIHGVIIWKSLDKSFEEYEVNAPHVIAAKKALNAGFAIDKLGKIGYIVMKGSGKISDRVEPYFLVKDKNKIDVDYYIEKQIIPSVMRILEPFGIKEDNLKGVTTDIMDYFRDL
ncbi:MAG: DNA polymerase domain-containing protein, partial [Metallosphaera sp.]